MKIRNFILLILFVCSTVNTFSQNVYHFKKGLVIHSVSRYGREALYADQLAYNMYTKTLNIPAEGDSFGIDERGQAIKWQAIICDSMNRLRGRGGFGGAYIYLTYTSSRDQNALLHIKGNSAVIFEGETHAGDPYSSGWLYIPIILKKGINEFYVRGQNIIAELIFPAKPVILNTEDPTMPFVVPGNQNHDLMGSVVVINNSTKSLHGLRLESNTAGTKMSTDVPIIPPMSTRKIIFHLNASALLQKGQYDCILQLFDKGNLIDQTKVLLDVVAAGDKYINTFISGIDGSLQYYAVTPQLSPANNSSALFLSVHGAGVEAIGQARAYQSKEWGTLVAATNRRPRGFNWEDWGRLDALEVLEIAKNKFKPDPQRVYLTGHSMGGHGTWFLGATYPDKWAAIAPCAGYPTLKEYGSADGLIPTASSSPAENILLRSGNQSDVLRLVSNFKALGIYILHGDADRVVPVRYARQMRKLLADFHTDLSYYEYPGGEHWFGDQSVDWKPLFEFFKWHKLVADSLINNIDFITANPGISDRYRWVSVQQQIHPLRYSRILLKRNLKAYNIIGSTENVLVMKLNLNGFNVNTDIQITIDSLNTIQYTTKTSGDSVYLLRQHNQWIVYSKPDFSQKGPHRYGTFKDAFNHKMVFVYGTRGTKEENEWSFNKARYDAETWYYRGNGTVDIIPDKEYSRARYDGRNIILYGNASSNSAYKTLLNDCPIQVDRNIIKAGTEIWQGDDLGAYFIWPIKGSAVTSVGVISGTGIKGMKAANANQYFAGGSGFPDFMIFRLGMIQFGSTGIKLAGFFDNNWKLDEKESVTNK